MAKEHGQYGEAHRSPGRKPGRTSPTTTQVKRDWSLGMVRAVIEGVGDAEARPYLKPCVKPENFAEGMPGVHLLDIWTDAEAGHLLLRFPSMR